MLEPTFIPTPAAIVAENVAALQNAYNIHRKSRNGEVAFKLALRDILDSDSYRLVIDAIAGRWGTDVPGFNGPSFGLAMQQQFEHHCQTLNAYQRRIDRRPSLDIVGLAEDLATDPALSELYGESMTGHSHADADTVACQAAQMLVAKANEAVTGVGRKVRLDQASTVIRKLGDKAANALRSGNNAALAQAQWCVALYEVLNNERRRR